MPIWSPAFFGSATSGGYVIEGSGLFNGTDGKLTRTISSAGNRKKFILEVIFKRGGSASSFLTAFSSGTDTFYWYLSSDQVYIQNYESATQMELKSEAKLRDFGAWYHLIVAINTEQPTETNRVKAWVNGVELTWVSSPRTYPAEDASLKWNTGSQEHQIGHSATTYSQDYFARAAAYDGETMTDPVTDGFGEYDDNGNWVPLNVSGKDFGTTGFLIEGGAAFTNGTDSSSNSQNFTKGGTITDVDDTLTDKASDNFGNYWTLTPLQSNNTLTGGNLAFTGPTNYSNYSTAPALPMTGKWYWEIKAVGSVPITSSANWDTYVGVLRTGVAIPSGSQASNANLWVWGNMAKDGSGANGAKHNNSNVPFTPAVNFGNNSIMMIAVDMDNSKIYFGNDGTWAGSADPAAGSNPAFTSSDSSFGSHQVMPYQNLYADSATYNFGATAFAHTPPTGFKALNTANLAAPTVTNSSEVFKAITFPGTGSAQNVDTVGFSPGLLIIKSATSTANWNWVDSVRGANEILWSNAATAESAESTSVTGFRDAGFSVGSDSGSYVNISGQTMLAYGFEAGTSFSESASGTRIASAGKKSSSANFSIAGWTHQTSANYNFKHGLSVTPDFFVIKSRDSGTNWELWHKDMTDTYKRLILNDPGGSGTSGEVTAYWANPSTNADLTSGSPVTSSLLGIQDGDLSGTDAVIGYFWARTAGAIGAGTYTGNGSADGPYIVVDDGGSGFESAMIIIKQTGGSSVTTHYAVNDSTRSTFNPTNAPLFLNDTPGAGSGISLDITANGFKIRDTSATINATSGKYLYMAFAEHPFGGDGVSQAKAR